MLFLLFTAITGIAGICFAEESRKSEDTVENRIDVSLVHAGLNAGKLVDKF
jgi:hypothetical protein